MLHALTGSPVTFGDADGMRECRVVHAFDVDGVTHLHVQHVQDLDRASRLKAARVLKHVERILAAGEWCDLFTGRVLPLTNQQRGHYEKERDALRARLQTSD